jgi:hypothetical protein
MRIYCQKCGTGIDYAYEKPNFCTKCGFNFSPVKSVVAKTIPSRPNTITHSEEETEDIESLDNIKNMSKLDVEVSAPPDRKTKFKDIIGTRSDRPMEDQQTQAGPIDKKEFLESFRKEAGFYPSRNQDNEEE